MSQLEKTKENYETPTFQSNCELVQMRNILKKTPA